MENYKKGDIIIREGEKAREILTLVSGKVGVFSNGYKLTEISEQGKILGELSVILNRPRTASLIALEDTTILTLARTVDELIQKYPDLIKKILYDMAERLADLTEMPYLTRR